MSSGFQIDAHLSLPGGEALTSDTYFYILSNLMGSFSCSGCMRGCDDDDDDDVRQAVKSIVPTLGTVAVYKCLPSNLSLRNVTT